MEPNRKHKKVIFLDIDGVLNRWFDIDNCAIPEGGAGHEFRGGLGVNPELVEKLNRVTFAHPDVEFVLSSAWRISRWGWCRKYFAEQGFKGRIFSRTGSGHNEDRSKQILAWCEAYGLPSKAVSLDDSLDAECGIFPFIHVDGAVGLTDANVEAIIQALT
jgi:hypothetical protein